MVAPPLIELTEIRKRYGGADGRPDVDVLRGVSLTIRAGEFVALMGPSGSGKSTLMHILGCLDRPTGGTYRFAGRDVAALGADDLARLRREAFGFVFQGYHLIPTLDALHNVQVPAVYAGLPAAARAERAAALLARLGLKERAGHRPSQLSGGQQQRVSIARALMNGGRIILADEPTGALDSRSGTEVMALLRDLADAGHTVILITHDPQVAAQARRVVRISDGRIVGDTAAAGPEERPAPPPGPAAGPPPGSSWLADSGEAIAGAWRTLWVSRFRTLLTLLGIVIGVASVIVLMAVGQAAGDQMLEKITAFGNTHRMSIRPGDDTPRGLRGILSESDVTLVRGVPNVAIAMPFLTGVATLRAGDATVSTILWSTSDEGPALFNWRLARGIFFTAEDERTLATVAVLGMQARERIFGAAADDILGRFVLIDKVPFQIIGELAETGDPEGDNLVVIPFSTASRRVLGTPYPGLIQVRVRDPARIDRTVTDITAVLETAHRVRDFNIANNPARVRAQNEAVRQQNLLLALIAGISLIVGGIGVMNIMLMAVKERTREIGIRMATGARQGDIQRQFLTEAVMVSLVGGLAGVIIGLAIGVALIAWGVPAVFSIRAILLAFGCAVATGLIFGFMPARQAARLDPVVALAGE